MVQVLEDRQGKGWVRDMEHWVGERGVREEWAGEGWERGLEGLEGELARGSWGLTSTSGMGKVEEDGLVVLREIVVKTDVFPE